ncbi:MAG: hypothetical protein DI577_10305, partial [Microbacterium sp.]
MGLVARDEVDAPLRSPVIVPARDDVRRLVRRDELVLHSVAGTLPAGAGLLSARPFRAPHHTISNIALAGGGA